jgi:hypothetical protein
MIVASTAATVAALSALAETAAKQFGKDESTMAHAVETGLVPFIELARNSPGQLYPSPIVLEILDFAQQFGAPEVKENLADLRLAEPASTDELVAAYTHTVETLRVCRREGHRRCLAERTRVPRRERLLQVRGQSALSSVRQRFAVD